MGAIIGCVIVYVLNLLIWRSHQRQAFSSLHSLQVIVLTLLVNGLGLWASIAYGLPTSGDLTLLIWVFVCLSLAVGVGSCGFIIVAACICELFLRRRAHIPLLLPIN